MRSEEYLAVQWSDADIARGTALIRRSLVRHKKSWSFEEPKTARSRRTVYLPASLLQKLAAHKRKQAEERLKLGAAWSNFDLIFCSDTGTPLTIPNITYRYFRRVREKGSRFIDSLSHILTLVPSL